MQTNPNEQVPPATLLNASSASNALDPQESVHVFPESKNKAEASNVLKKSKKCRCCPQSRSGRIFLICIIVLVITLITCLGYFYIPRIPQFKVLYVQVRPVNGDIPLNITQNSENPLDISLKLPIFMGISVINPNSYDLTVDNFDLTAYIQPNYTELRGSGLPGSLLVSANNNPAKKVGYSSYGSRNFNGNNFNTTFEIQVLLDYTPDASIGLLNDPAFGELLQVCGIKGSVAANRTMLIKYDVGISISFLSRLGIKPILPNDVGIKCPLTPLKIMELTNKLGI